MEVIFMQQNNPVFSKLRKNPEAMAYGAEAASIRGIILKTIIMFTVAIGTGMLALNFAGQNPNLYIGLVMFSGIFGFISIIVAMSSIRLAPIFSLIYAMSEGLFLVLISVIYMSAFDFTGYNIVLLAVLITAAIFFGMLILYSTKLIVVTRGFRRFMMSFGFMMISVILFVSIASIFDGGQMAFMLFGNPDSPVVLFLTLVFIMYGAFMLTLHFDNAVQIADQGLDKRYEWVAALGLMVAIVYIYYQVLRLLAIILSRRD
jgi:uncharacterized YccA/Bax inhibitor family protein